MHIVLSSEGVVMVLNIMIQSLMAHSSSSATQEAEETAVIIIKILNSSNCDKNQKKIFKSFLLQTQVRNLKFKTPLFTINWKLLLKVKYIFFERLIHK